MDHTPDQYKNNQAEFCGHLFYVNPDVLIPRLESEGIVNLAQKHLANKEFSHPLIVDIGTGSGCLGISLIYQLQKQNQNYSLFLTDISDKALQVTRKNVDKILDHPGNIFFQQSDLLLHLPQTKFDLILANLPYIPTANIPKLDPSVRDFEPHLALDGGPDGTTLINKLLQELPQYLSPDGLAILEFDDTQNMSSFQIPKSLSGKIQKDCFDVDRFLLLSLT